MLVSGRLLTIGEVAREAGVPASAIRYYESIGILPPAERESGQRRYGPGAIEQLRLIDVAKQAGFTLKETGALLRADAGSAADSTLRELAAHKLPEVDALITRAQTMRTWLTAAVGCTCATLDTCTLSDEPQPTEPDPTGACCRTGAASTA